MTGVVEMNAIVWSRTFRSGDDIAVCLPAVLGIEEGVEFELIENGHAIVLKPVDTPEMTAKKLANWRKMLEDLRARGPVGEIEVREPIEFPERPGL